MVMGRLHVAAIRLSDNAHALHITIHQCTVYVQCTCAYAYRLVHCSLGTRLHTCTCAYCTCTFMNCSCIPALPICNPCGIQQRTHPCKLTLCIREMLSTQMPIQGLPEPTHHGPEGVCTVIQTTYLYTCELVTMTTWTSYRPHPSTMGCMARIKDYF